MIRISFTLPPSVSTFPYESFGLDDSGPLLVSTADDGNPRCLLWCGNRFYFWHTAARKLFYVAEPYELRGILRRIRYGSVELQLQELLPLSRECFKPSADCLRLPPQEVPTGWSNRFEDFNDLRQKVDTQQLGLALPLPILASWQHGLDYFFFQCESRYYMFNQISSDVFRIEEPVNFQDILRVLNDSSHQGLNGSC